MIFKLLFIPPAWPHIKGRTHIEQLLQQFNIVLRQRKHVNVKFPRLPAIKDKMFAVLQGQIALFTIKSVF